VHEYLIAVARGSDYTFRFDDLVRAAGERWENARFFPAIGEHATVAYGHLQVSDPDTGHPELTAALLAGEQGISLECLPAVAPEFIAWLSTREGFPSDGYIVVMGWGAKMFPLTANAGAEEVAHSLATCYQCFPGTRLRVVPAEVDFQVFVYGLNERLIVLPSGRGVYPDGFTPQYGAIGEAKFVGSPISRYVPNSLGDAQLTQVATRSMDDQLYNLAAAAQAFGGNGVVEVVTNNTGAGHFIEGRMLALRIPAYVRIAEWAPRGSADA